MKKDKSNIAMQNKCIHCKKEQYGPAVHSISMGKTACPWCGKKSRLMTNEEYSKELINAKQILINDIICTIKNGRSK